MATKAVQKQKGAEVVKAAKKGKAYYKKNKHKINKAAKEKYQKMSHEDKLAHLAHQVFLRAMRHGATEAEAKKAKAAYVRRRKHRHAGTHAAGQMKSAREAQRQVREALRKKSTQLQSKHKNALSKIRSAKVPPAKRAAMRTAEKQRYAQERAALAAERMKTTKSHAKVVDKIKKASKKKGAFRLKDFISNFQKQPISKKGKRLVNTDPGVSKIAEKHFDKGGAQKKSPGRPKKTPAAAAPAAAAPEKKKPGRPKKTPAAAAPAAAAPEKRKPGRPKKTPAAAAAPEKRKPGRPKKTPAAAAPAAAAPEKKKPGRPKKTPVAAAPAAPEKKKPGRPKKTPAAAAPAAPEKKKPGRPAGSKNKPKETVAAKPAAKAAGKGVTGGKPAAKAPAKAAKAPTGKKPAAAAKPAAGGAVKKSSGAMPKKLSFS